MDEIKWPEDLQQADRKLPSEDTRGEAVYTLYQKDFLHMPDVNFVELALIDPAIRALFN